jgi:transposase-like protein
MAQINITLNQDEILYLLSCDRDEAFRKIFEDAINSILLAESREQLQAAPYERSDQRTDSRNGFRERELKTRLGKLNLTVPRHRNQPFKTMVFENYARCEAALVATMAEMVVNGVSTRKVSNVMEMLCDTHISKSAVSDVCKILDKDVLKFQNRPIEGSYPLVIVDATYFKVRENGRGISKALMIAFGITDAGRREILGFSAYSREAKNTWKDFLQRLKVRGLKDVMMITSDAHDGLVKAITEVYPDVPWQRCQAHFSRNISDKVPKKYQSGIQSELTAMFNCETIEEARASRDAIINEYQDIAEDAMNILDEGFDSAMTVMTLPVEIRKFFRTSNYIERLNEELKRRYDVIRVFPNTDSLIRLMGAVLMEYHKSCQSKNALFSKKRYKVLIGDETREQMKGVAEEMREAISA